MLDQYVLVGFQPGGDVAEFLDAGLAVLDHHHGPTADQGIVEPPELTAPPVSTTEDKLLFIRFQSGGNGF